VAEIGASGFPDRVDVCPLVCRQPAICQAQRAMAPHPEPLRSRGAKHSVHDQYWRARQQSQVTRGDYLCVLSPNGNSSSTGRRMDPAGVEPASATWTECCVPVTPRALSGVSDTILLVGCQIGRKSGSLGCAQGRLSTLPQHWAHSHISEIREM
jgi:hypothetical protein